MVRTLRSISVLVMAFAASPLLQAQNPFDGTWKVNAGQSKLPPEPFAFSLDKGIYSCPTCANNWSVRANGTDQPLPGGDASVKVTTVDPRTVDLTFKRTGKVYMRWTQTVSGDSNMLSMKTTLFTGDVGNPLVSELNFARMQTGLPGAHAVSGTWRDAKVRVSEKNRSFTYQSQGDEVSFSDTTGVSYLAKLDGSEAQVKGGGVWTAVSLKRVDDHTIQETDKRGALVYSVSRITVSADGKKLRMAETDSEETGQTFLLVADKQ